MKKRTGLTALFVLAGSTAAFADEGTDMEDNGEKHEAVPISAPIPEEELVLEDGVWVHEGLGFQMSVPPLWEDEVEGVMTSEETGHTLTFSHDDKGDLGFIRITETNGEDNEDRLKLGETAHHQFFFEAAEPGYETGSDELEAWNDWFAPLNGIEELFTVTAENGEKQEAVPISAPIPEEELVLEDGAWVHEGLGFQMTVPPLWDDEVETVMTTEEADHTLAFTHADKGDLGYIHITERDVGADKDHLKLGETAHHQFFFEAAEPGYETGSEELDAWNDWFAPLKGIEELFSLNLVGDVTDMETVNLNGESTPLRDPMFMQDDQQLMVPLREIAEWAGFDVAWNGADQTVEVTRDNHWNLVTIGEDRYNFARMYIELCTAPVLTDQRTFVPVTYLSEVLQLETPISEDGVLHIHQ